VKKWPKITGVAVIVLLLIACGALAVVSSNQATALVHHPVEKRDAIDESPFEYGMDFQTVELTTADGLRLAAWYIPSKNGAAIIVQHGYKSDREEMLDEAAMLSRHGYGAILIDLRAHGLSGGDLITFGRLEVRDVDAAYRYLLTRPEVDPERIGALGNSMGAVTLLLYAAQNPDIKTVVSDSAFASLQDEVAAGVERMTGLPAFPFAPLIQFFAEQQAGFSAREVAAVEHIGEISPRPVFILQGGADQTVSPDSGQRLYDAAGEPRELWFDPQLDHVQFSTERAGEYERRVVAFFDKYLLGQDQ
jgi:fermentation-respiration switch protein FrsA (DUF1100 family)